MRHVRGFGRSVALAMLLASAAACDSATGPDAERFDLVARWGGAGRIGVIELDLQALAGERVTGTATVGPPEPVYAVTGTYRPPTVYLRLTAPERATVTFVGEFTTRNAIAGSMTWDSDEPGSMEVLLIRR